MKSENTLSRRNFVASTSMAGAGALLMAFPGSGSGAASQTRTSQPNASQNQTGRTQTTRTPGVGMQGQPGQGRPPTPAENLTAHHGVVGRLLLIYGDASKQLQGGQQIDAKPLYDATQIIQTAVIQLHAPLEEQFIYPRLEKSAQFADTVKTLREQHAAVRDINNLLMELTKGGNIKDAKQVAQTLDDFSRMLAAHVAREHSEIFPAFREMTPPDQYMQLGQQFQQKEQAALGGKGLTQLVSQVASIEANFGFKNLAQFTAKARGAAGTVATEE